MARRYVDIEIENIEKFNKEQEQELITTIIDFMKIENWDVPEEIEEWEDSTPKKEVNCEILIDISKVKPLKFSDVDELPFYEHINDFANAVDSNEGYFSSYSELSYYAYKFNQINGYFPSSYRFEYFDINLFLNELFKKFKIPLSSFIKVAYQGNEKQILNSFLIGFKKDFIINFDGPSGGCVYYNEKYYNDKDSILYTILGLLKGVKNPKVSKNKIYIVYRGNHGFDKVGFDVKKIKIDLNENYNDGFDETADEIIKGLNSKQKTNLVILSGDAGTGKCVVGNTKITVRDKKSGKVKEINIEDLM